jgi:hypothetical protein
VTYHAEMDQHNEGRHNEGRATRRGRCMAKATHVEGASTMAGKGHQQMEKEKRERHTRVLQHRATRATRQDKARVIHQGEATREEGAMRRNRDDACQRQGGARQQGRHVANARRNRGDARRRGGHEGSCTWKRREGSANEKEKRKKTQQVTAASRDEGDEGKSTRQGEGNTW